MCESMYLMLANKVCLCFDGGTVYIHIYIYIKVKQSRNRPDVAQRVSGGLGSQIS